jgi:hypothetical protein
MQKRDIKSKREGERKDREIAGVVCSLCLYERNDRLRVYTAITDRSHTEQMRNEEGAVMLSCISVSWSSRCLNLQMFKSAAI